MKKDKHVAPGGPEVEFFLATPPQYQKGEGLRIHINGHDHWVQFGAKNKLPQEALEALQNAKSQTEVPSLDQYDPARRGVPRTQEDFYNPKTTVVYQTDFDIEILDRH
jgi:hypothetical protein